MLLWRCELRLSWRAQWISLLLHGVLAMLVLCLPWPLSYMPLWMALLVLLVFGCIRSQRRINACQGAICLLSGRRVGWQGSEWQIYGTPWQVRYGLLLCLRHSESGKRQRLWLMADSMSKQQWHDLRRLLRESARQG